MKCAQVLGLALGCLAVVAGCKKGGGSAPAAPTLDFSTPTHAQPRLPTIRLWLGPEQIDAEMAVSPDQIMTGMMFRTNVPENDAMIFVLPDTQQASFWMKNCFVPLSVAYIDPSGVIQEIHPLEPQNTNPVYSASANIRFALETAQGWFDRHHIGTGTVVRTERGSLMDTFRQSP